jgi:hypothetical protein
MSSTEQTQKKYNIIFLLLLVFITVIIRLPILAEPWGADQSGYGYFAKGIMEGKVLYRDMYDLTAYGVFFAYVLLFKLFGTNMVSIHIGHLLVSLATVILVYFLTKRLYGIKAAMIAALCCTIFSNGLGFSGFGYENKSAWGTYWYLSQREVFMAPLMLGAVYLMIAGYKKDSMVLHMISGVLIGLAAFFKVTAVTMLLLFIIFIIGEEFTSGSFRFKTVAGKILFIFFGFTAVNLPFIYYFRIQGALRYVYEALFVHLSTYAKLSRGLRIEALFSGHFSVLSENLMLWLFAAISCLYIVFKDRNRNNVLIVLWSIASLVMVWGQGKFFGYHFIILVPPFAVLTGYGMLKFLDSGPGLKGFLTGNLGDMRKTFMLVTVILSILGFIISNNEYYMRHIRYFSGEMTKEEYYKVFDEFPTHPYSFSSDYRIVEYLKDNSGAGDRLEVVFCAGDTVIHFLTGLEPATRFIQSWYLFSSNEVLSKDTTTLNLRRELIDKIINTSPRFILVVHIPLEELVNQPYVKDDPNVKRLNEFIRANYRLTSFPSNRFLFERMDIAQPQNMIGPYTG